MIWRNEALLVIDDQEPRPAALNMAIDEALLESATRPTFRAYRWARPSISFGYFGRFADVADFAPAHDLVRRWTGGGIVSHVADFTYSLVVPRADPIFGAGTHAFYTQVHRAVVGALASNGVSSRLLETAQPKMSDACFANPVRADVLHDDRKIAGAAQRRTRLGLLQQGSIQEVNLPNAFAGLFAGALALETSRDELPDSVLTRAQALAAEKYATNSWLTRR